MTAKRRLEITMEKHETTIIRFRHSRTIIYCEVCQANTKHFSIVQAERVLSLSALEISRLAAGKQIHSTETADGLLMVCGISLAAQANG
jgi:hypothetical protein